jgi:hypothetical protein
MRKHMGDRALLQDVAAAPDKLLIEPCGPDLERIDAVPHWKLARWFVGLGQVRGVTPEWASSYADRVPGEAGARLKCAFKIYRASKLLWPGDSVLVAEFIRRRSELGLTMHSGAAACSEALAAPAAPDALTSASAPAGGLPEPVAKRNARRLDEFEELGGRVRVSGGMAVLEGERGALQTLADREKAAGRPRSDRSDISKALKSEALRRHARQSG